MDNLLKEFILSLMTIASWTEARESEKHDVCNFKTFTASCAKNEVILMENAHYGQISLGSCISQNRNGFTRCQVDVLSYLDSLCSGRNTCQLTLPDENLIVGLQNPCLRSMDSYLQLQYNCIGVYTSPTPCTDNLLSVPETSGLLANFITGQTRQGSASCPWEVQGYPGQKIRLTLHDYGVWTPLIPEGVGSESPGAGMQLPKGTGICQIYARITEGHTGSSERTVTICGGEMREHVVYVSGTDRLQIALTDPMRSQSPSYFLLHYESIGCPAYIPPEGAVIEQHGIEILVRCSQTGNNWRVSCDGMHWTSGGDVKNCNVSVEPSMSLGNLVDGAQDLPQWILIVVIIVAAAIIAVPILVIGIVSFRRKHETVNASRPIPEMGSAKCMSHPQYYAKEQDPMLVSDERSQKYPHGREYTSTAHRNMAVRPAAVTPGERFPPHPFPPTTSENRLVHGTLSRENYQQHGNRSIFKPPITQHKYESPMFLRRSQSDTDPLSHELDSEHAHLDSELPKEQMESDTEPQ